MAGIVQLSRDSFYVSRPPGRKGEMGMRMPGKVLVLFTLPNCHYCKMALPKFAQLAASPEWGRRLKFATLDLGGAGAAVAAQSRGTTTEITAAPTQILYIDGHPFGRFKGEYSLQNITSFLSKAFAAHAARASQRQQQFHTPPAPPLQQQQANSLYGGPAYNGAAPTYAPDLSGPPALARRMQGRPATEYSMLGDPDAEDDRTLLAGGDIRPHNQPWVGEFKTLG